MYTFNLFYRPMASILEELRYLVDLGIKGKLYETILLLFFINLVFF